MMMRTMMKMMMGKLLCELLNCSFMTCINKCIETHKQQSVIILIKKLVSPYNIRSFFFLNFYGQQLIKEQKWQNFAKS